ncbi:U4/U6.U5 small nuclear ribonucleoprotein [Sesamum angolense]|uniref:U4/U6.U5 small nuclear ribonucleoprotein n=1 Tax=Sesamum angolense TaxID=2727404 RepID=A0AAE2C0I6_9LAMI|nr:U4/U6.U5 small nuclear ribonucleoprotein [Sesamum angolense]
MSDRRDRDRDREKTVTEEKPGRPSRSPSSPPRKRHRDDVVSKDRDRDKDKRKDDVVSKTRKKENVVSNDDGNKDGDLMDEDEMEMMKKFGIPVGFDSTKGKPVAGNDVGAVRKVTKRQPRQYMNRRGGFNRPLPAERNR